ncbi:MAG: biopolymer transporter ExbD [Acidobacteria bacterium]|nr:biopolymer transporter ExbD [Acidobacteriota bacterium]
MRIKKKKNVPSEIFTGSMADISFLLIIYFMITSAFSATRGLDFALPEDTQTPEIKQEDSIDVHVMRGGVIEVDQKGIPIEGLLPYVAQKLKQNPDKPVILRTDPDATYGDMILVFDELRQAPDKIDMEIKTISIPTRREIENLWSMLGIQ